MENLKLTGLLSILTPKDIKNLGEFIDSPFHNKNKKVRKLFELIRKYHPLFTDINFTLSKIFETLFPGELYHDGKIRNLISDLYKLTEQYIVYSGTDESSPAFRRDLLKALRARNADKYFLKIAALAEKEMNHNGCSDQDYFYDHWQVERMKNIFLSGRDRTKYVKNLQNEFDSYISCTLIELLRFYLKLNNEESFAKLEYEHTLQDEIIAFIKDKNGSLPPVIEIYFNTLMLDLTSEEEYLIKLNELRKKYYTELNQSDKYLICSSLQTFYVARINAGEAWYEDDFYNLMKESLDVITGPNNKFPILAFLNLVIKGTKRGDFKWIEYFIESYKDKLPAKYKDAVIQLSFGHFYYRKGKFNEALKSLALVYTDLWQLKIDLKLLLMKIYFENNSTEAGISLADSFRHFLRTEKLIPKEVKDRTLLFIKYCLKIFDLAPANHKEINSLLQVLQNLNRSDIPNMSWLLEKTKELSDQKDFIKAI